MLVRHLFRDLTSSDALAAARDREQVLMMCRQVPHGTGCCWVCVSIVSEPSKPGLPDLPDHTRDLQQLWVAEHIHALS
jgi:hypothetical protein